MLSLYTDIPHTGGRSSTGIFATYLGIAYFLLVLPLVGYCYKFRPQQPLSPPPQIARIKMG
jgi:hypothetical protein